MQSGPTMDAVWTDHGCSLDRSWMDGWMDGWMDRPNAPSSDLVPASSATAMAAALAVATATCGSVPHISMNPFPLNE